METQEEMSRYFWSASTNCLPVRRGIKLQEKDSFCMCCGICLIGAKSSVNVQTCEGLLDKLKELILSSINLSLCSTRVNKPCYRRIDSLFTKSKVLRVDLEEFRRRFRINSESQPRPVSQNIDDGKTYIKRAAKSTPNKQKKRPRKLEALFQDTSVFIQ
jgi:hypothetical protein